MFTSSFKKLFLSLFLLSSVIILVQAEEQPQVTTSSQTTVNIDAKVLQTQLLTILDSFIMLLDKIQRAVLTLESLPAEKRTELQKEFEEWGEKLKLQKAQNSLIADQTQLLRVLASVDIKIKAAEQYLHNKFTVDPFTTKEFHAAVEKIRAPKFIETITPVEIEKLLNRSQTRLKGFDKLITDLHKSQFNKAYSWISNKWNTPLFTFPSWGGGGNSGELGNNSRDFYASSLLKRVGIYSTGFGLILFNTPTRYLKNIPNKTISDWLLWTQQKIGFTTTSIKQTIQNQFYPIETVEQYGQNYFEQFGKSEIKEVPGINGAPFITASTNPTQACPLVQKDGYWALQSDYPEGTTFNLHFKSGTTQVFNPTTDFTSIKYHGLVVHDLQSQTYYGQTSPEQFVNLGTQNYTPVTLTFAQQHVTNSLQDINAQIHDQETTILRLLADKEHDNKAAIKECETIIKGLNEEFTALSNTAREQEKITFNQMMWKKDQGYGFTDPYTGEFTPISSDLIANKDVFGFPSNLSIERDSVTDSPNGIFNRSLSYFNWMVNINLGIPKIEIGLGAIVMAQIYEDFKTVKKEIPNIAHYIHRKLRGDKVESKGFGPFVPKETFDDIVGREDLKNQLYPLINFMINPASFIQSGRDVPHGFLLAGEPQTGKTLMVKALAGELSRTLKSIHGDDVKDVKLVQVDVTMLLKHGIAQYMEILRHYYAPCILFCDEFDLVGAQRSENKEFLAEVLTTLNGFQTSSNPEDLVVFIVATNRPENIDYAIRHYGRCGNTLYFEKPHFEDRKQFFEKFFKQRSINLHRFDATILAHETEYCSYGELKAITEAMMNIADKYNEPPHQHHALEAIDDVVRKIVTGPLQLSEEQQEAFATRYAAKAFATVALNGSKKLAAATIMKITKEIKEKHVLAHYQMVNEKDKKGTEIGGLFTYNLYDSHGFVSREDLIKDCKVALAGTIGQEILGLDYITFTDDIKEALRVANLIIFEGLDERDFCPAERAEKRIQVMQLVHQCRQEMLELLGANKDNFARLAQLLQRKAIIRESDIKQLFGLPTIDLAQHLFEMPKNPVTATQFPVIGAQSPIISKTDELTDQEDEEADTAQQEAQKVQDEAMLAYYNQQQQAKQAKKENEQKKQEEQEGKE